MSRTVLEAAIAEAGSEGERALETQLRQAGIPFRREVRADPCRKWRFDFVVQAPGRDIAVEVEGGTWSQGRHTRGGGYAKDLEKYNAAGIYGWLVLRFTTEMVESGAALETIELAMSKW